MLGDNPQSDSGVAAQGSWPTTLDGRTIKSAMATWGGDGAFADYMVSRVGRNTLPAENLREGTGTGCLLRPSLEGRDEATPIYQ